MALSYGQQLLRIEHLLRLGARPPVARELTRFSSEALVNQYYRDINHAAPPRGQLPKEYKQYVTAPVLKTQASVVVHLYQRLEGNGLEYCDAVISTYRQYSSMFGDNAKFGIDRVWHILRCVAIGKILIRQCHNTHCGALYVEDSDTPPLVGEPTEEATPGCPFCAELTRGRGGDRRNHKALPAHSTVAPLSDMSPQLEYTKQILNAEELCRLGARPPVVRDLTKVDNNALLQRIFQEQTGHRAPKGMLPSEHRKFVQTLSHKLQSSCLVKLHRHLVSAGANPARALISAYQQYVELFGDQAVFSINHVWSLMRSLKIGRLRMHQCPAKECRSDYIEDADSLIERHSCPVCWEIRRSRANDGADSGAKKVERIAQPA